MAKNVPSPCVIGYEGLTPQRRILSLEMVHFCIIKLSYEGAKHFNHCIKWL